MVNNLPPFAPPPPLAPSCAGGCTDSMCGLFGVIIHVVGSIGINIGQNLQALALSSMEEQDRLRPQKSKLWVIGMAVFAVASLVTFGALALASASVLVPLESVQFIVNIAFNKIVRKKHVGAKMYVGVVIIIAGIGFIVLFGHNEGTCYTEDQLRDYWLELAWWVYVILSFGVAAAFYVIWRKYRHARKLHKEGVVQTLPPHADIIEPVAFSLSSALFGGGQMIVHSKLLAELFELTAASGDIAFANWFFWLELLLTCTFGLYWLYRLSQCLAFYDPLFIIPLMQTSFIVFGAIAGGIYFHEFHHLHEGQAGYGAWALYVIGVLMNVGGVALIASDVLANPGSGDGAVGAPSPSPKGNGKGKASPSSSSIALEPKSATASPVVPFDGRNTASPPESPPDGAPAVADPMPLQSSSTSSTHCSSPKTSARGGSSRAKVVQATAAPVSRC